MKRKLQRGFTLIELLVVIAIIGILAAVVLTSLSTARSKGTDAANKTSLNGIRAQAEIVFDNDGNYDAVCEDTTVARAVSETGATCTDGSDNSGLWAVSVDMVGTDVASNYCIDSTGLALVSASTTASTEAADGACDGN